MMLRQDYPKAGIDLPPVLLPQEFLAAQAGERRFPQARLSEPVRLLSHCTEATGQPEAGALWATVFDAIGMQVETPATGCCGMAGLFGHQDRHQEMSRKLFDMSWRGHVQSGDTILATGFSCRCQAHRLAGKLPDHPLGLIARALAGTAPSGLAGLPQQP